jgi:hypothetical protein
MELVKDILKSGFQVLQALCKLVQYTELRVHDKKPVPLALLRFADGFNQ